MSVPLWKRRPGGLVTGSVLGLLSVVASGLLTKRGAPPAYGICVACHSKDLLAGLGLRSIVGAPAAGGLVLTTVGILLGAYLAARLAGEQRRRTAKHPLRSMVLGALTMCASLLALGCTTRIALRIAYGDMLAVWSMAGVGLAIAGYTGLMALRARRSISLTGGGDPR